MAQQSNLFDVYFVKYNAAEHKLFSDLYQGGYQTWGEAAQTATAEAQDLRLAPASTVRFEVRPCEHSNLTRKHGKTFAP